MKNSENARRGQELETVKIDRSRGLGFDLAPAFVFADVRKMTGFGAAHWIRRAGPQKLDRFARAMWLIPTFLAFAVA
jgi:hypothetical protein